MFDLLVRRHSLSRGRQSAALTSARELFDELGRREDRQTSPEAEQVLVARDEECALVDGECEEIIVVRIRRADRSWVGGVVGNCCMLPQPADEGTGFLGRNPLTKLRVAKRPCQLCDQQFGDDELELSAAA